ncbi:hypothetical protein Nepgr_026474 [Nepenthes gracilis]|uniref:Uncharacterized protein n=1 Tax=Nepenthes gracilis TaxID=150966 RepID=A0AAD3Y2I6_NEPGR|nr:hypothetical protein Nepgr_026474 [Nepenthes gracilis]
MPNEKFKLLDKQLSSTNGNIHHDHQASSLFRSLEQIDTRRNRRKASNGRTSKHLMYRQKTQKFERKKFPSKNHQILDTFST